MDKNAANRRVAGFLERSLDQATRRRFGRVAAMGMALGFLLVGQRAEAELIPLKKIAPYPTPKELPDRVRRGKMSVYQHKPSTAKVQRDETVGYRPKRDKIANDRKFAKKLKGVRSGSERISYVRAKGSFSGAYLMVVGDVSKYDSLTFLVKGRRGGEIFEIGLNDFVSHSREDSVKIGSIHRYLPKGVTKNWQVVKIPLSDFHGVDFTKVISLVFMFNEVGVGEFWIDELRFSTDKLINWDLADKKNTDLVLDNFDHSDLNLLGRKATTYKKLPSIAVAKRSEKPRVGSKGRSLRLDYSKRPEGWCGYYTLLNQVDGDYFDLSPYGTLSFMVRGERGGEDFELGMADKRLLDIGDSNKAGQIGDFLEGGVTTKWKEVKIPLKAFERQGPLDFSTMGSFVLNFNVAGRGVVYIDNLKFIRR